MVTLLYNYIYITLEPGDDDFTMLGWPRWAMEEGLNPKIHNAGTEYKWHRPQQQWGKIWDFTGVFGRDL